MLARELTHRAAACPARRAADARPRCRRGRSGLRGRSAAAARRGVGVLLISSRARRTARRRRPHRRDLPRPHHGRVRRPSTAERARIGALMAGQQRMSDAALSRCRSRRALLGMCGAARRRASVAMVVGLLLIAASGVPLRRRRRRPSPKAPGARPTRSAPRSTARWRWRWSAWASSSRYRANLTNVGGEGQIAVGGIAATACRSMAARPRLPLALAWFVPMLAAAARRRPSGAASPAC